MVRNGLIAVVFMAMGVVLQAGEAKVRKVLPHYLDLKGRHAPSPSLYARDAYQDQLRSNPELRSALRFDIHWKAATTETVELRLEARGAVGGKSSVTTVSEAIRSGTGRSRWSSLILEGEVYERFGELHAWRVTVWRGATLLAEQKSFLW